MLRTALKACKKQLRQIMNMICDFLRTKPILSALLVVVAISSFLNYCWPWLNAHHEAVRNVALSVVAILGTPFFVWRTVLAQKDISLKDKNTQINDRNSLTDTFTKTIEQLGATSKDKNNIEVRLGAIYALERLSRTNVDYNQPIIEILCSYVRQNSPNLAISKQKNSPITLDVQTAMTVIGKRGTSKDKSELNFSGSYRSGSSTNLSNADLDGAKFSGACFIRADLSGADLSNADLSNADLSDADLSNAFISGANLRGADLRGADLRGADLRGADLGGANLSGAKLGDANLGGADLRGAINLLCVLLKKARNWQTAYRDPESACGVDIPTPPSSN